MSRIPFETLANTIAAAFEHAGMAEEAARTAAEIHAQSSRDGVASHGLNRVPRFVAYLKDGLVDPAARPERVKAIGSIEVHDGHRGPGVLNALAMTDRAIEIARDQGLGLIGLRNTTHWMRGGAYGWRAAEAGCVLIAWTNTESCMPAWGGIDTRVGNNPLVIAAPRVDGPVVLDMAMSQYSYGRLQTTRLKGARLPYPGGFDSDGRLTDEPGPIEESRRILPAGYWKGSGLAILLDILAAVLSEGRATPEIDALDQGSCGGCSQIFIAIDPEHLGGRAAAEQVAESVVAQVNGSTPATPGRNASAPGQGTIATRADSLANGVEVDDAIWAEVQALAGHA